MKKNAQRSTSFIATRKQHLSEVAEDYVEILFDLNALKGEIKVCDVAEQLGVSHVTVIRTIERLKKKGYVHTEKNEPIKLTEAGMKLASFCKERHQFLLHYLIALGVPEHIATIDVEGMEHHVSEATIESFKRHLQLLAKMKINIFQT